MAGKKKIDDWYPIGRDLAARLEGARYGEHRGIYTDFEQRTGLKEPYLRRLGEAADAIGFIARFDRDAATKLQTISVKASIALERWLSYSSGEAISAARALAAGELSVNRLEKLEREARSSAGSFGYVTARPEELTWRYITAATDHLREHLLDRTMSWTSDSVMFLDDPMASIALPVSLATMTAPPFFSQIWSGASKVRPIAVVICYADHLDEADRQRMETHVFALSGLASFGFDGLLVTNEKDHAEGAFAMLAKAGLEHVVKVIHFEFSQ